MANWKVIALVSGNIEAVSGRLPKTGREPLLPQLLCLLLNWVCSHTPQIAVAMERNQDNGPPSTKHVAIFEDRI
jgi:hypothetical protein